MTKEKPLYELVTTTAGAISIRNNKVNEIMHNPIGPWSEANDLYVLPSSFEKRFLDFSDQDQFVLFDIGLGAAANSLAAIDFILKIKNRPNVLIVSFEKDLDLLAFAIQNASAFEHIKKYEKYLQELILNKESKIDNGRICWKLKEGDFFQTIQKEQSAAHLIYFDPYSPKANPEMWSYHNFQNLRKKCCLEKGCLLLTYSQATPIRSALIAADFLVGYGPATGLKEQTTQAATNKELLEKPIDQNWFRRWQASHQRYSAFASENEKKHIDLKVQNYFSILDIHSKSESHKI